MKTDSAGKPVLSEEERGKILVASLNAIPRVLGSDNHGGVALQFLVPQEQLKSLLNLVASPQDGYELPLGIRIEVCCSNEAVCAGLGNLETLVKAGVTFPGSDVLFPNLKVAKPFTQRAS